MRRSDREITDFSDLCSVISRCDTCRIAINGPDFPYIVPLSFGYEIVDEHVILYIHGAKEGLKHVLLRADNRVCVEMDLCHGFARTEKSVTTVYESIIGQGRAEIATGADAEHGLNLLLTHCGYDGFVYDKAVLNITRVYRIVLDCLTGKRRTVKA